MAETIMKRKTTIAGILYGVGKYMQTIQSGPPWIYHIGHIIEIIAVSGGLVVATDYTPRIKSIASKTDQL